MTRVVQKMNLLRQHSACRRATFQEPNEPAVRQGFYASVAGVWKCAGCLQRVPPGTPIDTLIRSHLSECPFCFEPTAEEDTSFTLQENMSMISEWMADESPSPPHRIAFPEFSLCSTRFNSGVSYSFARAGIFKHADGKLYCYNCFRPQDYGQPVTHEDVCTHHEIGGPARAAKRDWQNEKDRQTSFRNRENGLRLAKHGFFYNVLRGMPQCVECKALLPHGHQLTIPADAHLDTCKFRQEQHTFSIEGCIFCSVNMPNMATLPCGHVFMCQTCSTKYKKSECAVCRSEIRARQKLFY